MELKYFKCDNCGHTSHNELIFIREVKPIPFTKEWMGYYNPNSPACQRIIHFCNSKCKNEFDCKDKK